MLLLLFADVVAAVVAVVVAAVDADVVDVAADVDAVGAVLAVADLLMLPLVLMLIYICTHARRSWRIANGHRLVYPG